ncbi:MAG: alanine--tRNA ligase [Candidatus Latescibacterota bacterium]
MERLTISASLLRGKYFAFFAQKGCAIIPSAPLVPENDPTALFTTAGMQPLVPNLLGEPHAAGRRLVGAQRCFRTDDIEAVGDRTHLTFFEMLGNWSLGDYFKREMIRWSWEFLTGPQWLGLDAQRLHVTVFGGDEGMPGDGESVEVWRQVFAEAQVEARVGERILPLGRRENWWGPVGRSGPCGPDTEMFYDSGGEACGPRCRPHCPCGRFVEVWNDVFMEYNMLSDGRCERLPQRNVDTGMGVERTLAALNGLESVYETDLLAPLIVCLEDLCGRPYGEQTRSFRIVADHVRAAAHLIHDGVRPSNVEHGYVLRRLLRRVVRHARHLGLADGFWAPMVRALARNHPAVAGVEAEVVQVCAEEQGRFARTLGRGLRQFARLAERGQGIGGQEAFELFATYGFPLELTRELAQEHGLPVDEQGFAAAYASHQERSRQGSGYRFTGGLADRSLQATRYHTATHLLHAALRRVLGSHVEQRGSHINGERLRFDFSHPDRLPPEAVAKLEELVNAAIRRDYPVRCSEMTVAQALEGGAIGLFGERYGSRVKVYTVGDPGQRPQADPAAATFSKEVCGGPHAARTGELGRFQIVREQSAGAGVRRIRAVLG